MEREVWNVELRAQEGESNHGVGCRDGVCIYFE